MVVMVALDDGNGGTCGTGDWTNGLIFSVYKVTPVDGTQCCSMRMQATQPTLCTCRLHRLRCVPAGYTGCAQYLQDTLAALCTCRQHRLHCAIAGCTSYLHAVDTGPRCVPANYTGCACNCMLHRLDVVIYMPHMLCGVPVDYIGCTVLLHPTLAALYTCLLHWLRGEPSCRLHRLRCVPTGYTGFVPAGYTGCSVHLQATQRSLW